MTRHISTVDLHRLRYGELPTHEVERVHTHLDQCARCTRRLGVQQTEREAFALESVPPALLQPELPAAAANRPAALPWLAAAALAVLAAAALALSILGGPSDLTTQTVAESTRPKGALPALEVWIDGESGPRPVREGESLRAGDRVQPFVDGRGAPFVTLAGRDGTGALELWGVVPTEGEGLTPAPFGLTLDQTPGPQTFYALAADRPLDKTDLAAALAGELAGVTLTEETLDKQ